MSRRTAVRIEVLALAGVGLLLVAGSARAQQGWPIAGSNWGFYGGSRAAPSYAPSYYAPYSPSYYPGPVAPSGVYAYAAPSADYYNSAFTNAPVSSANYAYGAYSPSQENVARIRLVVPADAQVWFGNEATRQRGATRYFESPPLAPGHQYVYDVKVQWRDQDGREVTRTRQVDVSANANVSADFTRQ